MTEPRYKLHRIRVEYDEDDGTKTEVLVEYGNHLDYRPADAWRAIGEVAEQRRRRELEARRK